MGKRENNAPTPESKVQSTAQLTPPRVLTRLDRQLDLFTRPPDHVAGPTLGLGQRSAVSSEFPGFRTSKGVKQTANRVQLKCADGVMGASNSLLEHDMPKVTKAEHSPHCSIILWRIDATIPKYQYSSYDLDQFFKDTM